MCGVGLLLLTIILAVVFAIKKPKYSPESAVVDGDGRTTPLRNGYPTEPMTIRRDSAPKEHTHRGQVTEVMSAPDETVLMDPGADATPMGTQLLPAETELLPAETELLPQETQLIGEETALLR